MNKLISALAILFVAGGVQANAPAQWYTSVNVTYLYVGDAGNRIAVKTDGTINLGTCNSTGEFVLDEASSTRLDEIYSTVLLSFSLNKPIDIYTNGDCMGTGVKLVDVKLFR